MGVGFGSWYWKLLEKNDNMKNSFAPSAFKVISREICFNYSAAWVGLSNTTLDLDLNQTKWIAVHSPVQIDGVMRRVCEHSTRFSLRVGAPS